MQVSAQSSARRAEEESTSRFVQSAKETARQLADRMGLEGSLLERDGHANALRSAGTTAGRDEDALQQVSAGR